MNNYTEWMELYTSAVIGAFGKRVKFIGIQGSVARGEATESSDIDVVMILDTLNTRDIGAYREAVKTLPERERLCGFIGGFDVLKAWDKADLFTFYFDTAPIYGSIEELRPLLTRETAENAVLTGACKIYHTACHNYTHGRKESTLEGLRKSAFFILRMIYYIRTGSFVRAKNELIPLLNEDERELATADIELSAYSDKLLSWAAKTILTYGGNV